MRGIFSVLGMCFLLFSPLTYGVDNVEALRRSHGNALDGLSVLFNEVEKTAEDIRKLNERLENMLQIKDNLKNILTQVEREIDALKSCEGVPDHPDHG